ncbi:putative terminase small subunit [Vibrio phage 236O40-1]|nr:putative terminase small subunit [Vibrio phage 236O40-1]
MSMRGKKGAYDWAKLEDDFHFARSKTGVSLKDFCEVRAIPYSTASKHINIKQRGDNSEQETFRNHRQRLSNMTSAEKESEKGHFTEEKIDFFGEKNQLKNKHIEFIKHFFEVQDPKKAAELAGICTATGYNILKRPEVAQTINDVCNTNYETILTTPKRLEGRMCIIANACLQDFFDERGTPLEPHKWDRKLALAVKKYTVSPTKFGDKIEIELYDAQKAIELLGKPNRLFSEPEKEGDEFHDLSLEEIEAEIEELRKYAE